MLKVTLGTETETTATVRVEGDLVADWGALLETECLKCLARKPTLLLDFSGVRFIDQRSADMVRNIMQGRDVKLINCWGLVETEIRCGAGCGEI